jgi:hypothetical protein
MIWLILLIAIPTWVLLVAGSMLNSDPLRTNDYGEKHD